jgi:hypothetical protein
MAKEEELKAKEEKRKAKFAEKREKQEAESQAREVEAARKAAEEEAERAAEEAEVRRKAQKRAEEEAESAEQAEEEKKAKAAEEEEAAKEEAERIKAAKAAEATRQIEEEKKAKAAAAAKAERLQQIKQDYQKRRTQFTNIMGSKFFSGSSKQFSKQETFHILIYYTEFGKAKEEQLSYRKSLAFKGDNLKDAFKTFANKIRGEITLMPLREFALIGNRKLLLTTSIFDDFFETPASDDIDKKSAYEYTGSEYKTDRISHLFIGFGFQKYLLEWPEGTLDCDFEGYHVLELVGKDSKWTKVGPDYQKALKVFEDKSVDENASVVLTHSNGKFYKISGKQNENGLYAETYLALANYLQLGEHFLGPKTNE